MDGLAQSILRDARECWDARTSRDGWDPREASPILVPRSVLGESQEELKESDRNMSKPRTRRKLQSKLDRTWSYRSPSMPPEESRSEPSQSAPDTCKPARPSTLSESSGSDPLGRALFNFDGCTYLVTFPMSDPSDATFVELDELPWFKGSDDV